jgi:glycosyltransferase involved in cell wall biosynthesis
MENAKLITIIVCTYNRSQILRSTLESMLVQKYNVDFSFEVLVVNNNSTDDTQDVIDYFVRNYSDKFRTIFEKRQGKSFALNSGIQAANGEILAFTDDDVIVSNVWLQEIYNCVQIYDADCIFGKIFPIWPNCEIPSWLKGESFFKGKLGILDYGEEAFNINTKSHQFYGANFAIKKTVIDKIGLFKEDLGVVGGEYFFGEDTDFFLRILAAEFKIYYSPNASVRHKIQEKCLTKQYFYKWSSMAGGSLAIFHPSTRKSFLRVPLWVFKEFLLHLLKFFPSLISNESVRLVWKLKFIYYIKGFQGYYRK